MATVNRTADKLNFRIHTGDAFSHDFGFNWDLSAATFTAKLLDENEREVQAFVITDPQYADDETTITISLENTKLEGSHTWYMVVRDEDGEKTELYGDFTFIPRGHEN